MHVFDPSLTSLKSKRAGFGEKGFIEFRKTRPLQPYTKLDEEARYHFDGV
jgi:hypothetical protein